MEKENSSLNRRFFIRQSAMLATGISGLALLPQMAQAGKTAVEDINIIGPKEGFSPQIGTLVSMLTWMRSVVLGSVRKLSPSELDFLFDAHSNTIGAMLMHLAATESFYQLNTLQGLDWDKFPDAEKKKWEIPMSLGEPARKAIKGHDLKYYQDILGEVREKTLAAFRKKDDQWLMTVDPKFFGGQPTNNYCKWFHVCEHESNHNGQIKWLVKRLPGAKPDEE